MFKKILFPVDLSDASSNICPYVKQIAEKFSAEIHVIHVVHVSHYYSSLGVSAIYIGDFESEVKKGAEKKFSDFVSDHFSNEPIISKIPIGRPDDEIVSYAKSQGIDLIIMGHSSTGIARAIFGSVAGYVVKYSPVPVMVISPDLLKS